LITSRSLHEALIGYGFDGSRLYSDLKNVLSAARPSVVIHGILERYDLLDETETEEFIQRQSDKLGHGHDPARDYLVFQELVDFMQANHYVLIAQDSVSQPLLEDHPDAWTFKIGVFRNEDS